MHEVIKIRVNKSMLRNFTICALIIISATLNGQTDKKYIRKGNREYEKNKFSDAEISYKKAVDNNKQSPDAVFNVGDALYKQNKFEEAGKQFVENTSENDDKIKKSAGLYNLGNSLLKANKIQESIDAYKNSLKLRPDNREAKYNLAYAQDLLKQQQEQQKKQKQDKDKKDQNKDKNKQDQKKDQKDQNDKNKDQQKDQNKNQDKKQQQPQNQEISKDDALRLLNSLANDEKNVQEKVKLAKASKTKVRTVKNW
ncbi:MAG: tetratricopeptide repeat protein [Bacteroidales bacterium]|jgi:tetratricopeptide (TPR) repeat protein